MIDLAPRISKITEDFEKYYPFDKEFKQEQNQKVFLQTLLKGSFSMLGVKVPKSALKISCCNIMIFFKVLDQVLAF